MTYRSPLSVAGPGQGQGTREAGGEGLRAGCAKAGSSSRPAWVGQGRGGACSLPQPPRPHPSACRRRGVPAGGIGAVPPGHDLHFALREAAFPLQGSPLGSPEAKTAPRGGRRAARLPNPSLRSEWSPSARGTAEQDWWPLGRAARAPLGPGGHLGRLGWL